MRTIRALFLTLALAVPLSVNSADAKAL